ncbi:putative ribonuclease H-like domain-containing protein [Tanacetum coccineum]
MLADLLLPTTFWAEAVNIASYVQNMVLVTKPHNKTPYELLLGRPPSIRFMRPFGCPITILNTLDPLGKFNGKADEGFLVRYSINSKAFRVFNTRTRKVEENLHINFLGNKPNVARSGLKCLFDIDSLTKSMNYEPVTAGNQTNGDADIKTNRTYDKDADEVPDKGDDDVSQRNDSTASPSVSTAKPSINTASKNINIGSLNINTDSSIPNDSSMQSLENTGIFDDAYDDREVGAEADLNNLETTMNVSPISTTRIHKDHPKDQIVGDINSATQTRRMTKISKEHAMIEAMQEELLQLKLQKVWTLIDLPKGNRAIGTKWVYRNKKYERGIVVRNKARLVTQGYTQEEGIDYDEFFALVARIEAIGLFLAYASFIGLIVYQMDVKSAFLYGTFEEEVYVCQPPGFEDLSFPDKVYKVYVDDIISGFTKKSLCVEFEQMMHNRFQMSSMRELTFFLGLQTASNPMEPNKELVKDEEAENMDVHLYRSMIGSLMYLTAFRPDITFAVCAYARYLKGQPKLGLWYPIDSPFDLEAFSDSDYARASLDWKSTIGGCQFLGKRLISWQCKKQTIVANSTTEAEYVAAANCYETVYKEWEDKMERAATTISSLEAEQDSVKDDEVAIDTIPLTTKPPVIVEYQIDKDGRMGYFKLIRADGSSKRYSSMIKMLQGIDREDLEPLWKLVRAKHENIRPEDDYVRVLWGDLKVMFESDIKSDVWRNLQGYKVTIWKLFDNCGVHFVRFRNLHIFMLVEKRYPLTPITISNMLNKKLQADRWNEMCYQLLKLMTKQEKGQ